MESFTCGLICVIPSCHLCQLITDLCSAMFPYCSLNFIMFFKFNFLYRNMKFHAKIAEISVPCLWGPEDDKDYRNCHEFTVENVKLQEKFMKYSSRPCPVDEIPSDVSLIAGKYAEGFLHGPASSLTSKSIIYPCSEFQCKIDCPCQLCRYRSHYCIMSGSHIGSEKNCELCTNDYNDHMLHHRAYHLQCQYCTELHRIFPQYAYTVARWEYSYRNLIREPHEDAKSYIFKHCYGLAYIAKHDYGMGDKSKEDENSGAGQFSCDNCTKKFKRKGDLKRHEVSQHFQPKNPCHLCGQNFTRKDSLNDHINNVHLKKGSRFECKKCNEQFSKESNFHRHFDGRKNKDGSDKYTCNICHDDFCTSRKLSKHLQSHTKYECNECEKIFASKQNLETHTKNRVKESCPECGKTFCNRPDLNSHRVKKK